MRCAAKSWQVGQGGARADAPHVMLSRMLVLAQAAPSVAPLVLSGVAPWEIVARVLLMGLTVALLGGFLAMLLYRRAGPNEVLLVRGPARTVTNPVTWEREQVGYRFIRAGGF